MAYKEFLDFVEDVSDAIRTDDRVIPPEKKWTQDETIYYTQQIMIILSDKRKAGVDINRILDQRIEVRYEKGVDHSCKFKIANQEKSENSSFTQEAA